VQKIADGTMDHTMYPLAILPGRGPRWLRWFLDRGIPPKFPNDALFTAAVDLQARAPQMRKMILVISDGQAAGTPVHSVEQTRSRLVQSQIQVYGVAIGAAMLGSSMSLLHTYTGATGGDVYGAHTQNAMETAFSRIMAQARHQYILGYVSNNDVPGLVAVTRKIEVTTSRPGLKVSHRKSYLQYPAPK